MEFLRRSGVLLVQIADTHSNSKVALCHPDPIEKEDGDTFTPSAAQGQLWEWHLDFCQQVGQAKREYRPQRTIGVIVGDAVDKNVRGPAELVDPFDDSIILDLAVRTHQPFRDVVDDLIILEGTPGHVGLCSHLEKQLAQRLHARPHGTRPTWVSWRARLSGVIVQSQHHPRCASYRQHTRSSAAEREATETRSEYTRHGHRPPDLITRGHGHYVADSGLTHPTRCIFLGCWTLVGDYGHRRGYSDQLPDIAGLIAFCREGIYEPQMVRYEAPREEPWEP